MWKKTCVVLALNWLPAVASSQEAEAAFCNSMGAMTRNIAAAHQKGVPLREAITWLDQTDNDIAKGFAEMVIMDVYENNSHYTTPAIQERIITQTEDKFFLFCLKLFKD